MSDYVCSVELREFEKQFNHIVAVTHHDSITVFDDLLTYIITAFNPEPYENKYWKYTKEQNQLFYLLMVEWLQVVRKMIDRRGWYDAFGDFFMSNVGKTSQQYKGQFFTPHTICDFMAKIAMDDCEVTEPHVSCNGFGKRVVANDSSCGSGRMLLAAHAINCERGNRAHYFIGEDIDRICCKMAAINMCVHGMFGEVVCHDTLCEPHKAHIGYIINEGLYPFPGCPTIRTFEDDPMRFVACRAATGWMLEASRKKEEEKAVAKAKAEEPAKPEKKVPEQLTLNFF